MRPRKITIGIDGSGINEALKVIAEEKKWLKSKCDELSKRLAEMGATKAEVNFAAAYYDGDIGKITVKADQRGKNTYTVMASGREVLFIEFGTGLIGYGHPEAGGYGPGTYPPTDPAHPRWNQKGGWFYNDEGGEAHHTHGNPPNMPMYNSVKELEQELSRVVQEVFK